MFILINKLCLVLSKPRAIYVDRFLVCRNQLLQPAMQQNYKLRSCQKGSIAEPHSRHHWQHGQAFESIVPSRLEEGTQPSPVTAPWGNCIPVCDCTGSSQWPSLHFEALVWKGSSPSAGPEAVFNNISLRTGILLIFGDSEIYYFASRGILVNFQILITWCELLVFVFYKWKLLSLVSWISSQLEILTLFLCCFISDKWRMCSSSDSSCSFSYKLEGWLSNNRAKRELPSTVQQSLRTHWESWSRTQDTCVTDQDLSSIFTFNI